MAQDMVSRVLGALDEHRVALACVAVAPVAAVASYHAIMCLRFPQRPWFSFGAWTAPGAARAYHFEDPPFRDLSEFPWHTELEAKSDVILAELEEFLAAAPVEFAPYFRPDLVNRPGVWQTLGLKLWGMDNRAIMQYFPRTLEILRCIQPGIVSLSFNHLQGGGEVRFHQGNTNGIARFHLGLRVPTGKPETYFQVSGEKRAWEEGKLMAFTDAHWHRAQNGSDKSRYIMLFDVILDKYAAQRNYISARVAADLCTQYYMGRYVFLSRLFGFWRGLARIVLYSCLMPYFHLMIRVNPDILGRFS